LIPALDLSTVYLADVLNTTEFNRSAACYSWYKIIGIRVMFPALNSSNVNSSFFMKLEWDRVPAEHQMLAFDDNTKIVPMLTSRNLTFKYFPPNVNIYTPTAVFNPAEFNSTVNMPFPRVPHLQLQTANPGATAVERNFMVEVLVVFRGSLFAPANTLLAASLKAGTTKHELYELRSLVEEQLKKLDLCEEPKERPIRHGVLTPWVLGSPVPSLAAGNLSNNNMPSLPALMDLQGPPSDSPSDSDDTVYIRAKKKKKKKKDAKDKENDKEEDKKIEQAVDEPKSD
jgi:hypothetical protein